MSKYVIGAVMCLVSLQVTVAERPSASELLAKYGETQDKLQSFIMKSEDSVETTGSFFRSTERKKKTYFSSELRFDGQRISIRNHLWGDFGLRSNLVSEDKPQYQSFLWNGDDYFQYSKSPTSTARPHGIVKIDHSRKYAKSLIGRGYNGADLLGFLANDERIDAMLQQADTISVRDRMEPAGRAGPPCYVIDAVTKHGKCTLWIDPEHGYNIAKAEVRKKAGDMMLGQALEGKASYRCSLNNVCFAKIENVWVPMEAEMEGLRTYRDGSFHGARQHHKRIEVILNPDHDSLGSFVPDDIENGAEVLDLSVEGILYTWQDGKLIPNIDEAVIGEIDKMTSEILADAAGPEATSDGKTEGQTEKIADANDGKAKIGTEATFVPTTLSVSDLLGEYALTRSRLQSFIAIGESTIKPIATTGLPGGVEKEPCEFRFDGKRVSHRRSFWNGVITAKERPGYKSFLWDGKSFIQYTRGSEQRDDRVLINNSDKRKMEVIATEYKGAALMGICPGETERIDVILHKAGSMSVISKIEDTAGSAYYVIGTETEHGAYTVWVDPQHGYNIAKIEIQRDKSAVVTRFLLENVRFEKVDDVWVPMEADMQVTKANKGTTGWHHKRTQVIVNPDHDSLGSFVPNDIPDGTKVVLPDSCGGEYIWRDGKAMKEGG